MKQKLILISLLCLVMFMLPLSSKLSLVDSIEIDNRVIDISDYESHDPILITSNVDFADQGWPGNGTIENPYVIEDLLIDSVVYPEYPIRISNTRDNFIIRNCFLANYSHGSEPYAGIGLINTTNGIIENNYIDKVSMTVYLNDGSDISILNNKLGDVHQPSIKISDSFNIIITGNEIAGGILLEYTNDIYIDGNIVNGYVSSGGRKAGINGWGYNNTQIVNNNITVRFEYCIILEATSQISMINNTLSGGHGILAYSTSDVLVEGNYIEFYGEGIETVHCENWTYINNILIRVDDEPPIITPEEDIDYEVGTSARIEWHVTEANPLNYSITRDSIVVASDSEYGHTISISVGGLDVGIYDYVLIVYDTCGSYDSDNVLVTVIDTTLPLLNSPEDIEYVVGETENCIRWIVFDLNPDIYELYINGSLEESTDWDALLIVIDVDGLAVGQYNYTLLVRDTSGNINTDTVIVSVTEIITTTTTTETTTITETTSETTTDTTTTTTDEITTDFDDTMPLGSIVILVVLIGGICGIIALVVVIKRK